ncbi:MAG TPA: TolC family protein [Patescibacteria group bacterium]|nr:TolC family protein [Patescibacteria group bacterium]
MKQIPRFHVAFQMSCTGFCVLAALVITVAACGAEILSLNDCINIALKSNPEIGIAEEGYRKAQSSLLMNYGGLLPWLSADFSTGHRFYGPSSVQFDAQGRPVIQNGFNYEDYSFRISSDIVLFDGGGTINQIRSAMSGRDASKEELRYNKDLITARVIRAYYDLVRSTMLRRVQEEAQEQANKSLERTEALLEVGSATRADVLKARVLHSNTRLNMIKAKNAVELAREDLISLLNVTESRAFDVDTTTVITYIDPDSNGEIQFALDNRPNLKSLQYTIRSASAGIAAAKSGWLPTVGASFGYVWNDRAMADNLNFFKEEYMWSVIGYVSFNLFDRFATSANVRNAKANHRIAEYNLENAKLQAIREIKSLVFMLRESRERISVATETVEQAMEDVRLADERYRVGAGTMLETIDAQVALTQAKADVIDAKCDYLIAVADLARATGRRVHR